MRFDVSSTREVHIDPDRVCELCGGPIVKSNKTGVCRTTGSCRKENDSRRNKTYDAGRCKVCGGSVSKRNQIGICRKTEGCRNAAKKEHDHRYHLAHKNGAPPIERAEGQPSRLHRQTALLPEDGIIDPVAVSIVVNGVRKVALTHRERIEATRRMLVQGSSIREICSNLHVQAATVRSILGELGYECVRDEHIVGSKVMVILRKDRIRGVKILEPEMPQSIKPAC